jgi:hypothetical protein
LPHLAPARSLAAPRHAPSRCYSPLLHDVIPRPYTFLFWLMFVPKGLSDSFFACSMI